MYVRGTDFRPVMNASGAQGFFGEGYPFHKFWSCAGLTFENCGFVAKTTTIGARQGNMPLKNDGITPREWRPSCIVVKPLTGVALNAVGLSDPGASALLHSERWQRHSRDPFFISFMSVEKTASDRLNELGDFVRLLAPGVHCWNARVGLEINFSCPNVGLELDALTNEIGQSLDIAGRLMIPVQVKLNALFPADRAASITKHPTCDAITMGNTIPWGKLPKQIAWKELFGGEQSPLAHLGGGGLSGWPLLPLICDWIRLARGCGLTKPIWACGGIDSLDAVRRVHAAGASGVQLGTVALLRPWRMRSIVWYGYELFK